MTTPVFKEPVASSPEELLKVMQKKMKYKQHIGYTTYAQILQNGIATCWGAADFEIQIFEQLKLPAVILFLSVGDPPERTHSAVLFKDKETKKWFWFEWAWSKYEGINGPFNSLELAQHAVTQAFTDEYGKPNVIKIHHQSIAKRSVTDDEYLRLAF